MTKRTIDIVGSVALLVLTAPLLGAIALAVRLDSPGPALFRQKRVGRGGRAFTIYKFRSMRVAPPSGGGATITVAGDPRVTRIGRLLRRTKLDELPQLWNVLRGDMSLVGPRPESPRYVAMYSAAQRLVLDFRPGVTGAASLESFDEERELAAAADPERWYCDVVMPRKLATDIAYGQRATAASDAWILLRTAARVLRIDRGAVAGQAAEESDLVGSVGRSGATVAVARGLGAAATLAATPLVLGRLGRDGLGVWELLLVVQGVATVLQAAIGGAVTWGVASMMGAGDRASARRLVRGVLGAALALEAPIAIAAALRPQFTIAALGLTGDWGAEAAPLVPWIVAAASLGVVGQVMLATLAGCGRSGAAATIAAAGGMTHAALAVILLGRGAGLAALAAAMTTSTITMAVISSAAASVAIGGRVFLPSAPRWEDLRRVGPFFGLVLASNLTLLARDHLDKLLVGAWSATAVGALGVAMKLSTLVGQLAAVALAPLTAAIASLEASGDPGAARRLFERFATATARGVGLAATLLAVLRGPALTLWLGEPVPDAEPYLVVSLAGVAAAVGLSGAGAALAKGLGRPALETIYALGTLALVVALKPPLAVSWGGVGVVTASSLSWGLGAAAFFELLRRRVGYPALLAARVWTIVLVSVAWVVAAGFAPSPSGVGLLGDGPAASRSAAAAILLLAAPPLAAAYLASVRLAVRVAEGLAAPPTGADHSAPLILQLPEASRARDGAKRSA